MKRLKFIRGQLYANISILMIWVAALGSLYSDSANKIGLYVAMPLAFVFTTLINRGFRFNIYEKILYGLYVWDCISYLWADDKEMASFELHMLLGAFLLTYVVSVLGRNEKKIPYLYFAFILLYLSAWNYAVHHILVFMTDSTDRLNDEKLNANTLAYYTFYVSFLVFVLSEITRRPWVRRLWTFVFWFMLPVSFGVSMLTASRQILIVQIPLYVMLIYIRYIKSVSLKHKLAFVFVGLLCLVALSGQIISSYNDSYLSKRAEVSVGDDPRAVLAQNAIQEGIANFPFGLGAGNFQSVSITRQISHNSYLEAFVNMGLPGLALYVALLVVFSWRQWKRYRERSDKMYFVFFTFGVIYLLDGMFFVYYNALWLISFFMLVAVHSETYYANHAVDIDKHGGGEAAEDGSR